MANSPISPTSKQYYHDNTPENYHQQYSRMSPANFQQQQNEQHLLLLSLGKIFTLTILLFLNSLN